MVTHARRMKKDEGVSSTLEASYCAWIRAPTVTVEPPRARISWASRGWTVGSVSPSPNAATTPTARFHIVICPPVGASG